MRGAYRPYCGRYLFRHLYRSISSPVNMEKEALVVLTSCCCKSGLSTGSRVFSTLLCIWTIRSRFPMCRLKSCFICSNKSKNGEREGGKMEVTWITPVLERVLVCQYHKRQSTRVVRKPPYILQHGYHFWCLCWLRMGDILTKKMQGFSLYVVDAREGTKHRMCAGLPQRKSTTVARAGRYSAKYSTELFHAGMPPG